MSRRWGLQAKMTASYVVVTALAVLVVEAIVIGIAAPKVISMQDLQTRVRATTGSLAGKLSANLTPDGRLPATSLGEPGQRPKPGRAEPDSGGGVMIPEVGSNRCSEGPASFAVVFSLTGRVLASSYPACFPVGSTRFRLPVAAVRSRGPRTDDGIASTPSGKVIWATSPLAAGQSGPKQSPGVQLGQPAQPIGTVYVEVPATASSPGSWQLNGSLVRTGLLLLGLTILLGLAFGLISTRGITRRLRRLAGSTLAVADGEFDRRVPVTAHDEISQLETNFNRMAERLSLSLVAERQLAGANARHEERSRIARELHDSISQDLFSLSMLAGGLRKALPADSAVQPQVETMERTAGSTVREMQALLLELRPIALDDVGLAPAIDELCAAYRDRLGVDVTADVEPLALPTALEHAILRVAQESLSNAVRHADARSVRVGLHGLDGHVVLEVTDDGRGFDPSADADRGGMGLRTMRERAREQDGELRIDTTPGRGTTVLATFPRNGNGS
jgi:signal transduction histidine kinase